MKWVHVNDGQRWNPRPLPENFGGYGSGYPVRPDAEHYADGWRQADETLPTLEGQRLDGWRVEYGATTAARVATSWVNLAAQAAQFELDMKAARLAEVDYDATQDMMAVIIQRLTLIEDRLAKLDGGKVVTEKELVDAAKATAASAEAVKP